MPFGSAAIVSSGHSSSGSCHGRSSRAGSGTAEVIDREAELTRRAYGGQSGLPDGLQVAELADAGGGEFATEARVLDAAERQLGVGDRHAVDEHRARLDLALES